ncbi:MAG: FAD-dependent oxidoreductase [Burkholderiales bacterium]|nr:FAD-dependent oxidoreductase [Burkholderiales bacterium]
MTAEASPAVLFANYTQRPRQGPDGLWLALRLVVLALALGEIVLLFLHPALGLALFWTVAVPLLPGLWAIAPGLWRQGCPMAFVNQLPRSLGYEVTRALPASARYWSYFVAVALLVAMVALRRPLLNGAGWATGAMCAASLGLALLGGLAFKGRSGWCGTFCPLAPVQRSHGQAPVFVVRNGYCATCVGCQKNCIDFNPRAAIHGDLADSDPRHATQRLWFMAMLPGLIVGYYTGGPVLQQGGIGAYLAALLGSALGAAGLFLLMRSLFATTPYRMATVFGAAALLLYYAWAGPVLVSGVAAVAALPPAPDWLVQASRLVGVPIVWGVWRASLAGERAYQALERGDAARIDESRLKPAGGGDGRGAPVEIFERRSGKRFAAAQGKSLLESMEAAGVPIEFGCRSGLCGADPVGIVEGHEHLDEPGADEAATLKRLGLTGRARLACCTRARGPLTIDCDARSVPPREDARPAAPKVDRALASGIENVVIVGNGVAGMTVAEALRDASPTLAIDVVAGEPHHFYNRMSLGRVVYNRQAMQGMYLLPDSWYAEHGINVWLNTVAVGIDRAARTVQLGTGETLPYDRLVLATGASASAPSPEYADCSNAFVLRSAAHAQAIRAAVQQGQQGQPGPPGPPGRPAPSRRLRRAVVIGGGVLGVEAAEALHHLGLEVTLVHRGARLMDRQLDAEGAQRLAAFLENSGIAVLIEARLARFEIDGGRIQAMRLEDGRRVEGEIFVACAGVKPDVALASDAGLAVGRGVKVDARMTTDDPAIFAVGDVAEPPVPGPAGLWPVAVQQGRIAAEALLDAAPPAGAARVAPPSEAARIVLQLKSEGIDLRSFGELDAVPEGAEVLSADPTDVAWWRLVVQGGRALGAVYVGPPGTSQALTRALQAGADLTPCLAALRQRRLDLSTLAALAA